LGYCEPEAEQRYRDELPTMSLADRTFSATGFKQAINEALEASDAWTAHVRNRIDKALKARSLPTVEAMRAELERKKAKILKRGRILDEEEFSLVSDLLARPRSTLPPTRRENFPNSC